MKKILIIMFMLICTNCAYAADYNTHKLENGQTVIIKEVKNNPIVIIDTWIKTGSVNENDQNNGVSHFLEHLFFKGTKTHPPGEFDKILESKGAQTNAATSKDFTHYYVMIPSKHFDLAMELHADMLLNPLIPRKELEKERKVVMEEIAKDSNNPDEQLYNNLVDMLYTTHPYKRKVIGTNEIIGKITREEILEYYNSHYAPQNMVTVIIGDVDAQKAIEKVREEFKTEPRKITKNITKQEKPLKKALRKIEYKPVQSGYLLIGFRGATPLEADVYALDVLSTALGDGRTSILYQTIKEQKQLATTIYAHNSSFKEDGVFLISADFTPDNQDKLEKAIFEEITRVQKQGITTEQLKIAKNIIERDTYYSRESISNIASEMGYTMILTDNPKYYDEYLENIKKVSLADVKRVANKYLGYEKSATSLLLPEEKKEIPVSNKQNNPSDIKLVKDEFGIKKYSLSNGTSLLLNKNDLNDIVAISIYTKGGYFLESTPGTADITASVLTKGTQNYSSLEFAKILEENGIKINASASADTFSIDILTTKPQLSKTIELLDEVINKATLENYEIEKIIKNKLNSIKASRDVPLNLALEEYKSLIFENSVYSNGPKLFEKTLPKISREDVLDYYNRIFDSKNTVISVNGNLEQQEIAPLLDTIFKNKGQAIFEYSNYFNKICPIESKTVAKHILNQQTAWLIMGWQTPGILSQKENATLQVINSILGSGMSSRLFKNVRDKEGLAYQLGSSYAPKIIKGAFTMYIGTNPKTLDLAKEKMLFEINRLKTEFVSDKELQEAKDKIIGNFILSQETNLEKASTIGWFEASGRGFEFKNKYEKLINSITASDIVEVANKYFNQNYVTSIVDGEK